MAATEEMIKMPWIGWLDLDTEFGPDGSLQVILRRPKREHLNHNNHVNAPVIYGVAEVAGAGAVVIAAGPDGKGAYTVIRDATIKYSRPAHGGISASVKLDEGTAGCFGRSYAQVVDTTPWFKSLWRMPKTRILAPATSPSACEHHANPLNP
jgi:Putative thioesterase (yiiD_Cterm)